MVTELVYSRISGFLNYTEITLVCYAVVSTLFANFGLDSYIFEHTTISEKWCSDYNNKRLKL
jgi:hypothetical protein